MLLHFYKNTIAASLRALAEETANTIVYIFPKLASNTSTEIRARKIDLIPPSHYITAKNRIEAVPENPQSKEEGMVVLT
jgi:hypothetical protein